MFPKNKIKHYLHSNFPHLKKRKKAFHSLETPQECLQSDEAHS